MAQEEKEQSAPMLSERASRYRAEVEKVVREVGEHPLFELKRRYEFGKICDKIEFVKDIQSIATSKIDSEKYLVVGADEQARCFVNVDNIDEFDEAKLRQQLEKYLDPVPLFELFSLTSSDGKNFVLLIFPRQKSRRILAIKTVNDDSTGKSKMLIREGDLWTKGSSTGKRLATREDWDEIYEEVIELETERRTRQRVAHFLERATTEKKLQTSYGVSVLPTFTSDEEFGALVESICVSQDRMRFGVLLERLRDDLVEGWYSIDAFVTVHDPNAAQASVSERIVKVRDHKTNVFLPAMQKLTSAAIYVTKNGGGPELLAMAIQLLEEVYDATDRLRLSYLRWVSPRGGTSASSAEHVSHTVPAFESLVSLHLIGAYVAKRRKFQYLPLLLRRTVRAGGGDVTPDFSQPMAFWPLRPGWGEPAALQWRAGRIEVCTERVQGDPVFLKLFGSAAAAIEALCEYELLLEWNSYLAVDEKRTPESADYMKKAYPTIDFGFWPSLIAFPIENVMSLGATLLTGIKQKNSVFLKSTLFDENLAPILQRDSGQGVFARFIQQLDNSKHQLSLELRKLPLPTFWPKEIAEALKALNQPA